MFEIKSYSSAANRDLALFWQVLRFMVENREKYFGGKFVPDDLAEEVPLEEFISRFSGWKRSGDFAICDFWFNVRLDGVREANIVFQNESPVSGGGAELHFRINGDVVEFTGVGYRFTSGEEPTIY